MNPFVELMPVNDDSTQLPLRIGDNKYALYGFAQTTQTNIQETGKPFELELNLNDNTGIEHVGLYTNIHGSNVEVQDSDTYIIYDEDQLIQITDPHGFFSNVTLTTHEQGPKYNFLYNITFAKSMDTSDIIIRAWDEKRNSADTKIFNAIKVNGEPMLQESTSPEVLSIRLEENHLTKFVTPLPDINGNLVYMNPFGDLEVKKTSPYHTPYVYRDNTGRSERHDDGFNKMIHSERLKATITLQKLIDDPFENVTDKSLHDAFSYQLNVGKLDRADKDFMSFMKTFENEKAKITVVKYYKTNHTVD